jgi:hypothetical protein
MDPWSPWVFLRVPEAICLMPALTLVLDDTLVALTVSTGDSTSITRVGVLFLGCVDFFVFWGKSYL